MTFTYSGDPGNSDRDQVRFLVGDTAELAGVSLSDEEIAYLLVSEGSVLRAAVAGAERILDRLARQVNKQVGDLRIDATDRHRQYRETVARLRRQVRTGAPPWAGAISRRDKEARAADGDRVEPAFSRDLHTYPSDPATGDNY